MRYSVRFVANGIAVFLALYLVDTLAQGRFRLETTWIAVILAVILGLVNSRIRPLRRVRAKPKMALFSTLLTIVMNSLILQIFAWAGAPVSIRNFLWALATGAFVTLVTGTINWLVGYPPKEKPRKGISEKVADRSPRRERDTKAPRAQV